MAKFFNKLKKALFLANFGPFSNFWGKTFSPENLALSHTTTYSFLAPCQNLIQFQENTWTGRRMDRRMEGLKDGQSLFHRTLPTTAQGPE